MTINRGNPKTTPTPHQERRAARGNNRTVPKRFRLQAVRKPTGTGPSNVKAILRESMKRRLQLGTRKYARAVEADRKRKARVA